MYNRINKKAQIAETTTWIVATIIILIILIVSILILTARDLPIKGGKQLPYTNKVDLFAEKSLASYLTTKDSSGKAIYDMIKNDGQLNDFNGNLAKQIFINLYGGYYTRQVFLGIATSAFFCTPFVNPDAFGSGYCTYDNGYLPVSGSTAGAHAIDDSGAVVSVIPITGNKFIQMVLWHQ